MTHPAILTLLTAPLCSIGAIAAPAQETPQEPAATPAAAPAQEPAGEPAPEAAQGPVPLMSFSMGDMATATHHPKDAALVNALMMLDDRLAELPSEVGREMPPELLPAFEADSIPIWLRLLTAQKRVSMMGMPGGGMGSDMPFMFSVAMDETDEEAAIQYEAALKGLLGRMQAPFPMEMIQRNGSALMVDMGATVAPMGETLAAGILGGGQLSMEMDMNIGGYLDFLKGMMQSEGAPYEAMMMFDILGRMGLNDSVVQVATKCDGTTTHTASVMTGIGSRMRDSGILPEGGISAGHLAPVPADATWASVQRMDMEAVFNAIDALVSEYAAEQMGGSNIADMVQGMVGIDLRSGLFGALGDTYGLYASESTGGGGMTSTVMFFSLRDAEALLQTKEQIEEMINAQLGSEMDGYVSIRTWERGDDEYTTLMFPGLPVPLEPTIAMGEEWLVIAATPQAAMGAMDQIASGANSLASHAGIAPLLDGTKTGVSLVNAKHFARSGYGLTSMMLSGISNGVRSRTDATRNPGPIMPVYSTFKDGIQDMVGYTEVVGDNLVTRQTQDGSAVVQMATMMGFLADYGLVIAAPAMAAAIPQLSRNF